MYAALFVLNVR